MAPKEFGKQHFDYQRQPKPEGPADTMRYVIGDGASRQIYEIKQSRPDSVRESHEIGEYEKPREIKEPTETLEYDESRITSVRRQAQESYGFAASQPPTLKPRKARVLLSYAEEDERFAAHIAAILKSANIEVLDEKYIFSSGSNWQRAYMDAVRTSSYFLSVRSNSHSADLLQEQRYAMARADADRALDPLQLLLTSPGGRQIPMSAGERYTRINLEDPRAVDQLHDSVSNGDAMPARTPSEEMARQLADRQGLSEGHSQGWHVFLSYRRRDEPAFTGRTYDWLADSFGEQRVFMDVEAISPGDVWKDNLHNALSMCSTMLVFIGSRWLVESDEAGRRRIDDEDDWVRQEIIAGLERGKKVIPIVIQDARMPIAPHLPTPLQGLADRQAFKMTHANFRSEYKTLLRTLESQLNS